MLKTVSDAGRAMALATLLILAGVTTASAKSELVPVGHLTISVIAEQPTEIFHLGFEVTNSGTSGGGGGGGFGTASAEKIVIQRQSDAVSAELFRAVATGIVLQTARIQVFAPGTKTVQATYDLADVSVRALTGTNGIEGVELDFSQVTLTAGGQSFCWSFQTNTSC